MSRPVRTLQLGALALTAGAAWSGYEHHWFSLAGLAYGAFVLMVVAAGGNHHDQAVRTRHERARRAAILDDQALAEVPSPCCSFWRHSEGKVHGPDCTRPVLPRRDTSRLTSREQAAFEEIAADPDGRSVA